MKWRRDTCLPHPSSFAHLKLATLAGSSRRGCAEGSPRCRQFWSNICPRKNKSPLSLTTGRASLVSNRALLNRRRITDPRGPSIQADSPFLPFALAQPPRPPPYPGSTDFLSFFFSTGNRATDVARRPSPRLTFGVLIENFIGFLPSLLRSPSFVRIRFPTTLVLSRTSAIKISRSYEECGTSSRPRLSRPNTSLDTHRDIANLSRFLPSSFFRWKTRSCR